MPVDRYDVFRPTAEDVQRWFDQGKGHARYLAVMMDMFDGSTYPEYYNEKPTSSELIHVTDVYDLTRPFESART